MPTLSVCIIVKDQAESMRRCLESAKGLWDELIVRVDDDSPTEVVDVALSFGALIERGVWQDSFAVARNEALALATGDMVLSLDTDDMIGPNCRRFVDKVRKGELPAVSYTSNYRRNGFNFQTNARLFPRAGAKWVYRSHEQVAINGSFPPLTAHPDFVIDHDGYDDPEACKRKFLRTVHLSGLDMKDRPGDPVPMMNHGISTLSLDPSSAWGCEVLAKGLKKMPRGVEMGRTGYSVLLSAMGNRGDDRRKMLELIERAERDKYDGPWLRLIKGKVRLELGDREGAARDLMSIARMPADGFGKDWGVRHEAAALIQRFPPSRRTPARQH